MEPIRPRRRSGRERAARNPAAATAGVKVDPVPRSSCASTKTTGARRTGSAGVPISPSGSGARCARTTRRTATCWDYFPHDHARSRAYRWGEDGLLGISDRECRLCFALALWNGSDPILKERLFGLTGPEGNHGEDVKEYYFYLDSTPTHSYMKALYKYPQASSRTRGWSRRTAGAASSDAEFELADTGVFDEDRYFDVFAEYAKASPDDILIRITVANRGAGAGDAARPAARSGSATPGRGAAAARATGKSRRCAGRAMPRLVAEHETLGRCASWPAREPTAATPELLFTENETNFERLFGAPNASPYVKDAFHDYVVARPARRGEPRAASARRRPRTTCCRFRLAGEAVAAAAPVRGGRKRRRQPFGHGFERAFEQRLARGRRVLRARASAASRPTKKRDVVRQALRGLLWTKQFYHYVVKDWLEGDPVAAAAARAAPAGPQRTTGAHLYNRDVISMPDKWEYPWYAAWDLAFHMIPLAPSTRSSPRSSSCCSCASGTCTRTASSPPTSLRSAT